MSDLRQAAQQALEALENVANYSYESKPLTEADVICDDAINALLSALAEDAMQKFTNVSQEIEAALAEPVQEPVAWRTFDGEGGYDYRTYEDNEDYAAEWAKRNPWHVGWVEPLYTAPPQRKPLTEEEIFSLFRAAGSPVQFARAIERAHGITS